MTRFIGAEQPRHGGTATFRESVDSIRTSQSSLNLDTYFMHCHDIHHNGSSQDAEMTM